ncbi:MAG TPA: CoA transferase [Amycolatopsis sp.]|nr:CoA transferase [Amycolatopsis sp.]
MTTTSPLTGIRVLERTSSQAGRVAGMLLADLGADVVRVVAPGWAPAPPQSPAGPADLCWDRGKRFVADSPELPRLARAADILIDDAPPGAARPDGLDAPSLLAEHPSLVHVAMPPHGGAGRWRDLPADPLLTSALGGFAVHHPSHQAPTPIASVVPLLAALHGALGAMTAAAGLLGARATGHGRAFEVSGLHASAAALATMVVDGLDVDRVAGTDGQLPTRPNFRTYRCADGRWLHLSALTADFFLPALAALDRMDVMLLPGVEGEFTNVLIAEIGRAVGEELERTFAERPCDEWLAILAEAGVPSAPVRTREEWLGGDIIKVAAPPVTLPHPTLGSVVLPGVPLSLPDTPAAVRHLPDTSRLTAAADLWQDGPTATAPDGPATALPLEGLRVLDLATFLAAPIAGSLLADLGATVVKVESLRGDPYAIYSAPYAAVNHAKTVVSVDLRSPDGHDLLLRLAGDADALIDNLRPASASRLGLAHETLSGANPRLVHCSVSAFGPSGPFADLPGFDPVLQSRSGLAAAQGGDDEPVPTISPVVDVTTGALAALGTLAALVARGRTSRGQHVTASLAATSTFLQLAELTSYPGRPPVEKGGRDYRGPGPARRYHQARDGWVALAASTPEQENAVATLLGLDALTDESVAKALAANPVEHWLGEFARAGVPACRVTPKEGFLLDPYLQDNDFTHVIRDPQLGRFRLVRGYFRQLLPAPATATPAEWPVSLVDSAATVHEGFETVPDDAR